MMTQNEDDRTTVLGLFHYAHSYASAAVALAQQHFRSTHPEAPTRFLLAHSLELYLKAFLRLRGLTVVQLKARKLGHNFDSLANEAVRLGLTLSLENKQILSMMNDAINDRYIVTGRRSVLPVERLMQLCKELNLVIGLEVYRDAGLCRSPPIL